MGSSFFILEGNCFPMTRFGPASEKRSAAMGGGTGNKARPFDLLVEVATDTDQSLCMWMIEGSLKSGSIEFRDYDYLGSLKAIRFTDGACISYSDLPNPGDSNFPRLLSLGIIPAKVTFEGYQ